MNLEISLHTFETVEVWIRQDLNNKIYNIKNFLVALFDEIKITKTMFQGSITYIFPFGRWLARDEDDSAISRELVADKAIQEVSKDGKVKAKEIKLKDKLESKKFCNILRL